MNDPLNYPQSAMRERGDKIESLEEMNIQLQHALHEATRRLRVAEEALSFYGNPETYEEKLSDPYGDENEYNPRMSAIEQDCGGRDDDRGYRARQALREIRETRNG